MKHEAGHIPDGVKAGCKNRFKPAMDFIRNLFQGSFTYTQVLFSGRIMSNV